MNQLAREASAKELDEIAVIGPPIACGEWVVGRFDKAFKYRAPG